MTGANSLKPYLKMRLYENAGPEPEIPTDSSEIKCIRMMNRFEMLSDSAFWLRDDT